ncbi:hypothetical protein AMS68_003039 [Peltaster fructicola]|uniref:AB hydrolase-1 domain-containing protein n=1 Tax=Peltaster fructicola TaxID=286661 RepID=A0A6H0XRY0_9PEZI|nr:hypothetical protein AMS68_003039 [Peltaster fructicola]
MALTFHNLTVIESFNVHYLEAGAKSLPTLLLLHGFPASSNQFKTLAPLLAHKYHVVAPDYPGFGLTTYPDDFVFTFDNIAGVIAAFISALQISTYALYIFDYGAPVGLRIALQQPQAVKAIISQNGNAYDAGFGQDFWAPIFNLWNTSNSQAARDVIAQGVLSLSTTKAQYTTGVPASDLDQVDLIDPTLDYLLNLQGTANQEHQLDLFYDYRTNPRIYYPKFHEYFRKTQVPLLAIWGKGDPAFIPAGAEAFKQDLPKAVVKFVDTGHFALQTKLREIAHAILEFLPSVGFGSRSEGQW